MKVKVRSDVLFSGFMLLLFAAAILFSLSWPPKAKFYPMIISLLGVSFTLWLMFATLTGRDVVKKKKKKAGKSKDDVLIEKDEITVDKEIRMIFWLVSFVAIIMVFGFWAAILAGVPLFMRFYGKENWTMVAAFTVGAFIVVYFAFYQLMGVSLFGGALGLTWD